MWPSEIARQVNQHYGLSPALMAHHVRDLMTKVHHNRVRCWMVAAYGKDRADSVESYLRWLYD
jgi:hypothetical protein